MLKQHTAMLEAAIQLSVLVADYSLESVQLSPHTGYIEGRITFLDGSQLAFFEFIRQTKSISEREKYRYHFMDEEHRLIFRYDNAAHHPAIATHPHHKHLPSSIIESTSPPFSAVLAEAEAHVLGIP